LHSDQIFLSDYRICENFRVWLYSNKIFTKKIIKKYIIKKKKKEKIITKKITTPEKIILEALEIKEDSIRFYRKSYNDPTCPYTNEPWFWINKVKGEIWIKYETILNKIKNVCPQYQEYFYRAELNRLCDRKFSHICESCGSKNEKCAIYCSICGKKINN
ncbi:hypothetical protein LCGC14_2900950, partial [marine sediment metagenome]